MKKQGSSKNLVTQSSTSSGVASTVASGALSSLAMSQSSSTAYSSKSKHKNEKVVVHVRMRPPKKDEKEGNIELFDVQNRVVQVKKDSMDRKSFQFDSIMDPNISQEEVFLASAKPVIDSVLEGFNGTVFTYGQTGTGKTHTMVGQLYPLGNKMRGVIPRSLEYIFEQIAESQQDSVFEVQTAFIQIYMEMLQDLLEPDNLDVRIREDPGSGVFMSGVQWVPVKSTADGLQVFSAGERNRATSFTKLNAHSSRSHAVFIIRLDRRKQIQIHNYEKSKLKGGPSTYEQMTSSILYLVDLAGSERVKKSQVSSNRLDEAKKINFSLAALGNCIHALTDAKQGHVPFRDSKLTRLLSDSLGGNSKTAMVVTIGPSKEHTEETIMSLQFAARAMKVENQPIVNKKIDYKVINIQLQSELDEKTDQLMQLEIKYSQALHQIELLTHENIQLKTKHQAQEVAGDLEQKLKQIQQVYEQSLQKSEAEHRRLLEEVDASMAAQEQQLHDQKALNQDLMEKLAAYSQIEKEKIAYEQRVVQLSSELQQMQKKHNKEKIKATITLQKFRSDQKGEVKSLNDILIALNEELANLKQQNIDYESSNEKLNDDLKNKDSKIEQLLATQSQNQKSMKEIKDAYVKMKAVSKSYVDMVQQAQEQIKQQEALLSESKTQTSELEAKLVEMGSVVASKEDQIEKLKIGNEKQSASVTEKYESIVSQKDQDYKTLADAFNSIKAKKNEMQNTYEDKLGQQEQNYKIQIEQKLEQIQILEQKQAQQNNINETLSKEKLSQQNEFKQMVDDLNNQLQKNQEAYDTEKNSIKKQNSIQQAKYQEKINKLEQQIEENQRLHQAALEGKTTDLMSNYQSQLAQKQLVINGLEKEMESRSEEHEMQLKQSHEDSIQALQQQQTELQSQLEDQLASQNSKHEEVLAQKALEIENLKKAQKRQLDQLQKEHSNNTLEHQQQIAALQSSQQEELENLEQDRLSYQNKMEQQIQKLQQESTSRIQDLQGKCQTLEQQIEENQRLHQAALEGKTTDLMSNYQSQLAQKQLVINGLEKEMESRSEEHEMQLKQSHEDSIQALQQQQTELQSQLEDQLASQNSKHEEVLAQKALEIENLKKAQKRQLDQLQKEHSNNTLEHQQQIAALQSSQQEELENLEQDRLSYQNKMEQQIQKLQQESTSRIQDLQGKCQTLVAQSESQKRTLALEKQTNCDLRDGIAYYLLDTLKYQVEKQSLKQVIQRYDQSIKNKRNEITQFQSDIIQRLQQQQEEMSQKEPSDEAQVMEIMSQMITVLEIQEMASQCIYGNKDTSQSGSLTGSPLKFGMISELDQTIVFDNDNNNRALGSTQPKLKGMIGNPEFDLSMISNQLDLEDKFHQNARYQTRHGNLYERQQIKVALIMKNKIYDSKQPGQIFKNISRPTLATVTKFIQSHFQEQMQSYQYQANFIEMLLYVIFDMSMSQKSLQKQYSKSKKRLVQVLKSFDQYKNSHVKKEKFSFKLDHAARKIQRYWRSKKTIRLAIDRDEVTHKYILEKLQAEEALYELEDSQIQTGRFLLNESFLQLDKVMKIFSTTYLESKKNYNIPQFGGQIGLKALKNIKKKYTSSSTTTTTTNTTST